MKVPFSIHDIRNNTNYKITANPLENKEKITLIMASLMLRM